MTQPLTHQAFEVFNSMQVARLPENVQASVVESIAKARQTHANLVAAAKENMQAVEEVMLATQSGARALGDKVFRDTLANMETWFESAEAMARAKTVPAALELQGRLLQEQLATGREQAKELFELSTRVARQTFDGLNVAVSKTFAQFKPVR